MNQGNDLRIGFIQTGLYWEDPEANRQMFARKMDQLSRQTDLVILPEMFTTGFSMQPERLAEPADGETLRWLRKMAAEREMVLTGSIIVEENGNYFNRLFVVYPKGTTYSYDKRHLFRMGEENKHYTPGREKTLFHLRGWGVLPLICYDLRFPVWSRNQNNYDLLLYVANWPESRRHVWRALLVARALENQAYVAGINRIGQDGQGLTYSGDSMVIHPKGHIISTTQPGQEASETVTLSREELDRFRQKFPVAKDADDFVIK